MLYHQKTIDAYHKASENQKILLHFMALAYFPLETHVLQSCLDKISLILKGIYIFSFCVLDKSILICYTMFRNSEVCMFTIYLLSLCALERT